MELSVYNLDIRTSHTPLPQLAHIQLNVECDVDSAVVSSFIELMHLHIGVHVSGN